MPSLSAPDLPQQAQIAVPPISHHAISIPALVMVGAQRQNNSGSLDSASSSTSSTSSSSSSSSLPSYSIISSSISPVSSGVITYSSPLFDFSQNRHGSFGDGLKLTSTDASPPPTSPNSEDGGSNSGSAISNSSSGSSGSLGPISPIKLSEMGDMACAFGEDHGKLVLKAGTFNKIVEWIVFERECDRDTHIRFLLTYKLHSTPQDLFKVITESFLSKSSASKEVLKPKLTTFLREWVGRSMATDFRRGLFKLLLNFVIKELPFEANHFKLLFIKDSARLKKPVVSPKGEVAVIMDWMTITPEVLAQQITLYEWEIFQEIQPSEFYSNAWQKRDKELLSPHLTQLARFFNSLSFWIATEIIRANANNRLKVLKRVLLMADKLHELHNYDGMMAVISALSNSSISRLRKLWDSLSDKYHEIHQRLEDVMKPTSNFKVYREAISAKPKEMPVVPYLAVYLRDITFVCDGNRDRTSDGLVNFEKIQLLGSRIQEVQASTSTPYTGLTVDLSVRGLIKNLSFWEDDILYEKSLECEALKGSGMHHNGHGLSTITEENEEDDQFSEGGSESTNSSLGVETWSIAEVSSWMESIGKGEYREVFEQHRINGSRLVLLDDPTLGAMGMQRLGHRKRLLKDILELSTPKASPSSTSSSSNHFPSSIPGLRSTMSAPVLTEEIVLGWGQPAIDSWVSSFHDPDITNSLKGISAHALLALSHETLVARGLDKLGLRKKVLKGVQSLKQSVSTENIYHTDPSQWTVNDVLSWLERSDHGDYKNLFIARKINGEALLALTIDDLHGMGITKLGHRKALLKFIQSLKEQMYDSRRPVGSGSGSLRVPSSSSSSSSTTPSRQRRRSNPLPLIPSASSTPPIPGPRRSSLPNTPQDESPIAKAALGDLSSDEGGSVNGYSDDDTNSSSFDFDGSNSLKLQCFVGNNSTTSRVINVKPTISMYQLSKVLQREFGKRMNVKFIDKDGDLVTISDADSLSVAILTSQASSRLVLYLHEKTPSRRPRSSTGTTSS